MRTKKRIRGQIAIILALCMIFTFIPWIDAESVYAKGEGPSGIFVNSNRATVQYKIGASESFTDLPEGGLIESELLNDADSITFQITPAQNQNVKGMRLRKRQEGGDIVSYISLQESDGKYTYTLTKNENVWSEYEIEVVDWDVLFDKQFKIIKCGSADIGLRINSVDSKWDDWDTPARTFVTGEAVSFSVTQGTAFKVIIQPNDSPKTELVASNDGTYTFTPNSALGFEIRVYTSEEQYDYDSCGPNYEDGEFQIEYRVFREQSDEQSSVTCNTTTVKTASCDGDTKLVLSSGVTSVSLTISPAEGYHYEICDHDGYCDTEGNECSSCEHCINLTKEATDNNNTFVWEVSSEEGKRMRPEIRFIRDQQEPGGENTGEGDSSIQDSPQDIKDYIEGQKYAFGDWNEDEYGKVTAEDLKMGMACQIFYPKFSQNGKLQTEYGINTYSDLLGCITIQEDVTKNITAKDAAGNERTIKGYTYTVTLTPSEQATEAETVTAKGVVYGLAFNDDSTYAKNSRGCIIAVTEKNGTERYHLCCAEAYTADTENDVVNLISSDTSKNEGTILVVDDFDVTYDAERGEYRRGVSIFGNGASLDALLSQEEDTKLVAYQGRNENFIGDVNRDTGKNWDSIFGIFTFCQKDFVGSRIKGSGAEGNTPSWAFNQYPIYSTADSFDTENEAVVYFGNRDVTIEPVDNVTGFNSTITGIESVTTVDNLPEGAVAITNETNKKWKVQFKSDYYDTVKIKIVYQLAGGSTKNSYININRVGIDILEGGPGGGDTSMTLFHGTEDGPRYTPKGNYVIWGTYYYPTEEAYKQLVDLYVTYTWADGSVSREIIRNKAALNLGYNYESTGNCASSDFILYDGTRNEAPVKIQTIVVASGFDSANATEFAGAKFGAGKGVSWTNYYRNEN